MEPIRSVAETPAVDTRAIWNDRKTAKPERIPTETLSEMTNRPENNLFDYAVKFPVKSEFAVRGTHSCTTINQRWRQGKS
jgi:hypothetical protein